MHFRSVLSEMSRYARSSKIIFLNLAESVCNLAVSLACCILILWEISVLGGECQRTVRKSSSQQVSMKR